MANHRLFLTIGVAFAVLGGLVALAHIAPATAYADLLDDLLAQTPETSSTVSTSSTSTASGTSTATTPVSGTTGPAIVPAATPLIINEYSTDPIQLQGGTRFALSLTIKNPGSDSADDVVVQIGPSSANSWDCNDDLVVLNTGSAIYVGSIAAGSTNNSASFQLMANPTAPGGMRSVPVKMTWKSKGYEHTTSQEVGLLVNSMVSLDTALRTTGTPVPKQPFNTSLRMANTANRTLRNVFVVFSGSGASPSNSTSVTVGDVGPGASKTIPMRYTAPIVGRAKLTATISYVDDFGDRRTVSVQGWAHVQRMSEPAPAESSDSSITEQIVAVAGALLGLNG